jgi:hypothetical protein
MNYYFAVCFGCVIFSLLQLNGVFNLPDFKWRKYVRENVISVLLNLIIGCFIVYARADLVDFYPITLFSAFILGIAGQAILKKLTNMMDKGSNTVIGFNDNNK